MNLRREGESRNSIWIGNECHSRSTFYDRLDVVGVHFMRQMTQNAENRATGQYWCECVQRSNNRRIAVHIMVEFIERRVHDDIAEANGQREEALHDSLIPHLSKQWSTVSWVSLVAVRLANIRLVPKLCPILDKWSSKCHSTHPAMSRNESTESKWLRTGTELGNKMPCRNF